MVYFALKELTNIPLKARAPIRDKNIQVSQSRILTQATIGTRRDWREWKLQSPIRWLVWCWNRQNEGTDGPKKQPPQETRSIIWQKRPHSRRNIDMTMLAGPRLSLTSNLQALRKSFQQVSRRELKKDTSKRKKVAYNSEYLSLSHKNLLGLIDLQILPKAQQTQGIEAINELQNLGSWSNLVLVVFGKGREIHVTT